MKKTLILMALAALALSCAKENELTDQNNLPQHKADYREVTITASPEQVTTKTFFNKDNGTLSWNASESDLAVYDGTALQSFTFDGATDGKASFTGNADVATATWTAVHPYSHASLEGGKVYVTFPCIQEARNGGGLKNDMNTVAAQVTHDGSGNIEDCVLKNVGGLLKLTVAKTGIKTITVSSRGGQALTGKAELTFDGSGNPVLTPVATKHETETFVTLKAADMSAGLAAGDYFVSVFPAAMTTGLIIDMENIDKTVASIKTSASATVNRNSDLEFSGFDTKASWYTPATTTMELKFMNVTWPFVETTATGGTADDAKKWAGNVEKQLTYTKDNTILFYVNCSNYCSANGANGLRMGKGQGDYLLFPALPGKNLTKVEVKFVSGKTDKTRPAIKTRGGSDIVLGGNAASNITAGDNTWQTWSLVGTAHNMQYRYELTGTANDVTYIEQINLTYASKPSSIAPPTPDPTTTVLDMVFWEGSDYTVDGAVLQPFTTNLPIWNTDTDSDFVLSKGGNNYTFHFYGLQMRLAVHKQWRGLNLNKAGSYIKFPAISGYKLTKVEGVLGGRSYEDYVAASYDPDTPATHGRYGAKQICISTSSNSADSIKDYAIAAASIVNPAVISIELDSTADNTSYYLVTGTDGVCLRNLTITYTEVSSPAPAPAPAPAQLLDGGVTIL